MAIAALPGKFTENLLLRPGAVTISSSAGAPTNAGPAQTVLPPRTLVHRTLCLPHEVCSPHDSCLPQHKLHAPVQALANRSFVCGHGRQGADACRGQRTVGYPVVIDEGADHRPGAARR